MDSNFSIATDRPSRSKPLDTFSDEQVVESLQKSLSVTLKDASSEPRVKERMAKVQDIFSTMPNFWRQKPRLAQGPLEKFGSEMTDEQRQSLAEIDAKLNEVNASLRNDGRKVHKTLPVVIGLLNGIANPHLADENFVGRITKASGLIARRVSEAELSKDRKVQRRSMHATLQPSQLPSADSPTSRSADSLPVKRPKSVGLDFKPVPIPEQEARSTEKTPSPGWFARHKHPVDLSPVETRSSRLASHNLSPRKSPKLKEGRYEGTFQASPPYQPKSPRSGSTSASTGTTTSTTTNTTTTTTTTSIATSPPATTATKHTRASSTTPAKIRERTMSSKPSDTDKLDAIFASQEVLFSDSKTYKAALKLAPKIDKFFGQDAVFALYRLTDVFLRTAVERCDMDHQEGLRYAIAKADLPPEQRTSLQGVWGRLKDDGTILGWTDEAFTLKNFLRAVESEL